MRLRTTHILAALAFIYLAGAAVLNAQLVNPGTSSGGGAVTIADGADVAQGTTTDAACATDNGTCTDIALTKRTNQRLTTVNTTLGTPLQAGGTVVATQGTAASLNATVVGTGTFVTQSTVTQATAANLNATVVGTGTFATQAAQSGTWNVTNVSGTVSLPTGAATSANQTTWQGATAAAPPANAVYTGVNGSGATGGLQRGVIGCDASIAYDASTNGSTELVALTSGRTVYVCGYTILAAGTVNVKLIYGTGTACATGSANMTPAYQLTAQVGLVDGAPAWRGLKTASANALCLNTSAGIAVQAIVYYSII